MNYNELVLSHFHQPRNVGEFAADLPGIARARVGTVAAGNVAQLELQIEHDVIQAAKFKAYGEPYVIAACSYLTEQLTKKSLAEAEKIDHFHFAKALAMPTTKLHTALLVEDLLKAALSAAKEVENV